MEGESGGKKVNEFRRGWAVERANRWGNTGIWNSKGTRWTGRELKKWEKLGYEEVKS